MSGKYIHLIGYIPHHFGYILSFISLLMIISTCFWLIYFVNEILLNKKKLNFVSLYVNDRDISEEKEKYKRSIWKNTLLSLVCFSEGLGVFFGGLGTSRVASYFPNSEHCTANVSSNQMYFNVQISGFSVLFTMLYVTFMNILTVFFISIYSFNPDKQKHKKLLIYTAVITALLVPILLIPYTAMYAHIITVIIMAFSSVNWIKNTKRLLTYLKWRRQDMEYECPHKALQMHRMARRYKIMIYVVIAVMQPLIFGLFLDTIATSLDIWGEDCTKYYMLEYLGVFPNTSAKIAKTILILAFTITLFPVVVILLLPFIAYTLGYTVFLAWKYMLCGRARGIRALTEPFLKY